MDVKVTFIGNATMLLRAGDLTLLTDPNFLHQGQYAYLGHGIVSRRRYGPALTVDELPPVDAIVLSHLHGDHWDRVAQNGLDHSLPIITTPKAASTLRRRGFEQALGLQTWQAHTVSKGTLTVTATSLPGRHAPGWAGWLLPPVMGTMLDFSIGDQRCRLYISGDTLLVKELNEIPVRFDAIDAGVLHLGGTRIPAGVLPFGLTVTMDDQQGAGLVELLDLPKVIPIHFDDYTAFASPLSDFLEEMKRRGLVDRIVQVERGATVTV